MTADQCNSGVLLLCPSQCPALTLEAYVSVSAVPVVSCCQAAVLCGADHVIPTVNILQWTQGHRTAVYM